MTGSALAGMIVGFTALGAFILYAIIMICVDTALRKVQYDNSLKDVIKELRELGFEDH